MHARFCFPAFFLTVSIYFWKITVFFSNKSSLSESSSLNENIPRHTADTTYSVVSASSELYGSDISNTSGCK